MVDVTTLPVVEPLTAMIDWLITTTARTIPIILSSVLILFLAWLVSKVVEKVVLKSLQELKLKEWEDKHEIRNALFGISLKDLASNIARWFVFLLIIKEAAGELGITFISNLIETLWVMLPDWFFGSAMIIGALLLAHGAHRKIETSPIFISKFGSKAVYLVIVYFGLVLALPKFGFQNTEILVDTFILIIGGLAAGIAIAIGVAFGSALKEPAKKMIEDFMK